MDQTERTVEIVDQTERTVEVEELEARLALQAAFDEDDAAKIEVAQTRAKEAVRARIDFLNQPAPAPPRELVGEIKVSRYLERVVEQRSLDGAEAEFNQEMGIDDNSLPLAALLDLEDRADAVSKGYTPFIDNVGSITPRVFKRTAAGRLGIAMPSVGAGKLTYPYMTSGTTAAIVAESGRHDATAAVFASETITPVRLTANYVYTREAVAAIGSQFEPLLRNDIRMVMGDKLDDEILNGPGSSPTRSKGIFGRINTASVANGATGATADDAEFGYRDYRRSVFQWIDDHYSVSPGEVRILIGLDTWKHAKAELNSNNNPQQDSIQAMQEQGATVLFSSRVPATSAATSSKGLTQEALWTTIPGNVLVPVWDAMRLIVDPYTQAQEGQIRLSIHMLFGIAYRNSPANTIRGWNKLTYVLSDKT